MRSFQFRFWSSADLPVISHLPISCQSGKGDYASHNVCRQGAELGWICSQLCAPWSTDHRRRGGEAAGEPDRRRPPHWCRRVNPACQLVTTIRGLASVWNSTGSRHQQHWYVNPAPLWSRYRCRRQCRCYMRGSGQCTVNLDHASGCAQD